MFTVINPKSWPTPPVSWNFSLLKEIETCPRQWALSAAAYPELWGGLGYPPANNPRALAGQAIHAAVSNVCAALSDAGCTEAFDVRAVGVLRKMGGFTEILGGTIDRIVDRHRANPRLRDSIERLRSDLRQEIPAMRQQVQRHLNRVSLIPRRPHATGIPNVGALREGSYHELRLRSEGLAFTGIVDLLQIENGQCTIWEFKTGVPDNQHAEQLRTYALLWAEDKTRNPNGTPVGRMILSYDHQVQELYSPDAAALATLGAGLSSRIKAAVSEISDHPPKAHPAPEYCRFCNVRQLCPEYWAARATWQQDEGSAWVDVEVRIGASRGPRSWDAIVLAGTGHPKGTSVALLLAHASSDVSLQEGKQVRMLNVRQGEADGVPTIGISSVTEIFGLD